MSFLEKHPLRWKPVLFWGAIFLVFFASFNSRSPGTLNAAREWTADFCSSNALADQGHSLMHGVPSRDNRITWSMPGFVVSNALVCSGSGLGLALVLLGAAQFGCALLIFGMGRLLVSTRCGILAALLFLVSVPAFTFVDRWLYILTVLLVAFVTIWRHLQPSWNRSLLLGISVGISLYILSPLLLFPFLLVSFEAIRSLWRGSFRLRPWLVDVAALCLVPVIMLTPWIWMNWQLNQKFVLLEDGRAGLHLVTAALGLVHTVPRGDAHSLAGLSKDQSVLWWAMGEVLSHPGRYVLAVLQRVTFVVSLNPWLVLFGTAGLGLGLYRKWKGTAALALLVGYWAVLHSLMSTEQRYFLPFWPLLFVPAISLMEWKTTVEAPTPSRRQIYGILGVTGIPLVVLVLFVYGLLLTYPSRAADPLALDRELARSSDNAWLLKERGVARLRHGLIADAATDLSRAVRLRGDTRQDADLKLKLAWTQVIQGTPLDQIRPLLPAAGYGLAAEGHLLEGFAHLRLGDLLAAREGFQKAGQRHEREILDVPFLRDGTLEDHLVDTDDGLRHLACDMLSFWPTPQQAALLADLGTLVQSTSEFYLDCVWLYCSGLKLISRAMDARLQEDAWKIFLAVEWTQPCKCADHWDSLVQGIEELAMHYQQQGQHPKAKRLRTWLTDGDPQKRRWLEPRKRIP